MRGGGGQRTNNTKFRMMGRSFNLPPFPSHFILSVCVVLYFFVVGMRLCYIDEHFVQVEASRDFLLICKDTPYSFFRLIVVPHARRGTLIFSLYSPRIFIWHNHRLPFMRRPVFIQRYQISIQPRV